MDKYGIALKQFDRVRYAPPTRATPSTGTVEHVYAANWIQVWWDDGNLIAVSGAMLVKMGADNV